MEVQKITLDEFYAELLSAVTVCFEGNAEQGNGEIVYTAPNGQRFRITTETIS